MTAVAEYIGGPYDGRVQAFPGAEPPPVVVVRSIPTRPPHEALSGRMPEVRYQYVRDAEPAAERRWRLRFIPQEASR